MGHTSSQQEEGNSERQEQSHKTNVEPNGAPATPQTYDSDIRSTTHTVTRVYNTMAVMWSIDEDLQEKEKGQDAPEGEHHLQPMFTAPWDHTTRLQDHIDAIGQPEATCGSNPGGYRLQ